jgi:hypothetical protein
MLRRSIPRVIWILSLLVQTSPAPLRAFNLGSAGLTPVSLPVVTVPLLPPLQADFDRDGISESLALANGRLTILSAGAAVWQSPPGWTVVQAGITDLNRDGNPEATMLVWRPFHPWPVDHWLPHGGRIAGFQDDQGNSCHLILIGWRGRAYGEVWAGSALAEPMQSFAVGDVNGDTLQELLTLEGSYADPPSAPGHVIKVWEWNGFGFSVVSSIKGNFNKFALVWSNAGRILILVP